MYNIIYVFFPVHMIKINLMLYKIFKVNYIIRKQKVKNAKENYKHIPDWCMLP